MSKKGGVVAGEASAKSKKSTVSVAAEKPVAGDPSKGKEKEIPPGDYLKKSKKSLNEASRTSHAKKGAEVTTTEKERKPSFKSLGGKKKSRKSSALEQRDKIGIGIRGSETESHSKLNDYTDEWSSIQWEMLEEYYGESQTKIEPVISRTSMYLLDYRQFKAARTIQTAFRGWYVRHKLAKQIRSAIIIQRAFRRFFAARFTYRLLEKILQERIEEYHFKAAQKIQALWRGWWVRENVHDHYKLTKMQVYAAEDLLQCVAFKLHHLLRTFQIPGVYSLRNSHCLSKVENLLAAISFKHHNDHMRSVRSTRESRISEAKTKFKKCTYHTTLPYAGPDYKGICDPKFDGMFPEDDADRKMLKILSMYDRAANEDPRVMRLKSFKSGKIGSLTESKINERFCDDVVQSMKRWNILSESGVSVDANVFRNPQNVENFLKEIESIYSLIQGRCNCNVDEKRLEEIAQMAKVHV